ncbi:hypothetical protein DFH08DRAFT_1035459 [Mycena albidolilacea]|uniref:Uncharacterized protein n=1 Tax=Mycena albidolilacea TaxID=1033008 RepID=A0AAD6ZEJ4_9AGAR|nr:hypothetical protein DFH08DRAFT_1035459 [Mycena albidolilacea]
MIAHVLVFPPAALTDEPGTHPEPNWKLIGTFSVVSKTGSIFLGEHSWPQELHCTLSHPALSPSLHLHTIRFGRPASIYRLTHTSIVTGPKLRGTIWPSSFAFRVNPKSGATCAIRRFAGIVPLTLVYTDGLGLPINYARALSTLPHLHAVRVALPYSPRGTHISLDPTAPPDSNAELWAGECERCVGAMYEGPAFRTRYIARKQGVLLPNLTPSAAGADRLYRDPPALGRVEGNVSDYAGSDYGEEEREEEYDDYAWEEMEREMGVELKRE